MDKFINDMQNPAEKKISYTDGNTVDHVPKGWRYLKKIAKLFENEMITVSVNLNCVLVEDTTLQNTVMQ
jgi:hypothetical protein